MHTEEVTCMQKLKFVLDFKRKKTSVYRKNSKRSNISYYKVIFNIMTSSQKCLQI